MITATPSPAYMAAEASWKAYMQASQKAHEQGATLADGIAAANAWRAFLDAYAGLESEGAANDGNPAILRQSYAFLVWRKGKSRPPRFRHETLVQAQTEAERLAVATPGASFVVLQEICRFKVSTVAPPCHSRNDPDASTSPLGASGSTEAVE